MAIGSEGLQGPRLEYVLRKLPGTVERIKMIPPPEHKAGDKRSADGNIAETVVEMAGYMLFLPNGNCYRLTEKQIKRMGYLEREPSVIGFESANDTKTAVGRFKLAVSEGAKKKAYLEMENEVVKRCLTRVGSIENAIFQYDPKGKVTVDVAGAA